MMERKTVTDSKELDLEDFNGTLEEVIKRLTNYQKESSKKYTNVRMIADYVWDDVKISLLGDREETDEEFGARVEKENKKQEKIKKRELKRLAELKKKYGENND